jgi:hypothetical protein
MRGLKDAQWIVFIVFLHFLFLFLIYKNHVLRFDSTLLEFCMRSKLETTRFRHAYTFTLADK